MRTIAIINKKMRSFKIITIVFLFIVQNEIVAQNNQNTNKDSFPYINTAYKPGEYLKYKLKYSFVSAGYAEMRIDMEQIAYDWYYHVKAIARTSGLTRRFAKINDKYESYIDITTGMPIRAVRDINENKYRKFNEIIFRRKDNTVISLNTGEHKVPPGTLDILSAFYYARKYIFKNELKKNEEINITTFFSEKLYIAKIKYKKTEKIRTDFGKMQCLKFVPVLDKDTPFKKEDDLQVWFSDDGNFIPVKIRLNVGYGTVKCDLKEYKNLKNSIGMPFKRIK